MRFPYPHAYNTRITICSRSCDWWICLALHKLQCLAVYTNYMTRIIWQPRRSSRKSSLTVDRRHAAWGRKQELGRRQSVSRLVGRRCRLAHNLRQDPEEMSPPKLRHGSVVASKFLKPQGERNRKRGRERDRLRYSSTHILRAVSYRSCLCSCWTREFIIQPRIEVANINLKAFKAHSSYDTLHSIHISFSLLTTPAARLFQLPILPIILCSNFIKT